MECLFCKFVNREIQTQVVFENEAVFAFRDNNPQAPTHVLVVPKKHVGGIDEATDEDDLQSLLLAVAEIARQEDLKGGYRVVINSGIEAGQTVFHLHAHLLAGRLFGWPPG